MVCSAVRGGVLLDEPTVDLEAEGGSLGTVTLHPALSPCPGNCQRPSLGPNARAYPSPAIPSLSLVFGTDPSGRLPGYNDANREGAARWARNATGWHSSLWVERTMPVS